MMLDIICLYHGNAYDIEYVKNLANGVHRNLKEEYRFTIFTDRKDQQEELCQFGNVVLMPQFNFNRAWWNKMWLFSKESGLSGKVLYFDLDVILLNTIDKFIPMGDSLRIIHDFNRSNVGLHFQGSNSSIMSWDHEQFRYLWDRFKANMTNYTRRMRGDQDFIQLNVPNKLWYPDNWAISYKWEYLKRKLYNEVETSVLVFHGKPKQTEINDKKLLDIWRFGV